MKILIFLFGLGFAFKFNIVGSISISELFLIPAALFVLPQLNWRNKELSTILILYVCLFVFQLLSELIVGNSTPNIMKGLAITVVSFLHLCFLIRYMHKDLSLLPILILALALSQLIEGPDAIMKGEQVTLEDLAEPAGSGLIKFYIAPIMINVLLFLSVIVPWKKFAYVLVLVSLVFFILGARSSGLVLFLTGVVSLVVDFKPQLFSAKNLLKGSAVSLVLIYILYCIYVLFVMSGKIGTGNTLQLMRCDNPYNPFELLLRGRAETWVGWQAFMDHFFFGHGSWAYDRSGTYLNMLLKTQHLSDYLGNIGDEMYLVPSHSVIIGAGTNNGVFAFVTMVLLILFFVKRGLLYLSKIPSKYRIVYLSFLFSLLWNAMFSPMSHFRLTLPVYCAGIFILYRKFAKQKRKRIKIIKNEADTAGSDSDAGK